MDWGPVSKSAPISLLRMAHLATLAHPFLIVLSRAVRDSKYATFGGLDSAHIAATETPFPEKKIGGAARSGVVLPSTLQSCGFRKQKGSLPGQPCPVDY